MMMPYLFIPYAATFVHVWLAFKFISFHVITPALVVAIVSELPVRVTLQSAVIVTVPELGVIVLVPLSLIDPAL